MCGFEEFVRYGVPESDVGHDNLRRRPLKKQFALQREGAG
jgi:hypothetical protein